MRSRGDGRGAWWPRVRAQEGALAPAFLFFLVAAVAGVFFFLQVGHGMVLARGASTASDAAALAAANNFRTAWGQYVSWHKACVAASATGGSCGPSPLPSPGDCPPPAASSAANYAQQNDAVLIDCRLTNVSMVDGIVVRAAVRGSSGTIQGPSSTIPQARPSAQAAASVPVPPGVAPALAAIAAWADAIQEALSACDGFEIDPEDEDAEPCVLPPIPAAPPIIDELIVEINATTLVRLVQ